jgi:hypothetical protein
VNEFYLITSETLGSTFGTEGKIDTLG